MKKIILIFCLFFLFSTSLLAKENVCDWIITDGDYQEYLDDLPSSNFYSAFHVVVGNDGRCSYGWDWWDTNRSLEQVIQMSFNDCKKYRKEDNIDGGECKPYDINAKIVWNKPELYAEIVGGSKMKTSEEMIAASSEAVCDWIFTDGKYQHYLYELPKADFHSAFHVVVGSDGRCTYGWSFMKTRPNMLSTSMILGEAIQDSFNDCEKWRKEYDIDGGCKPYDVDTEIVWSKPERLKEITKYTKPSEEVQKLLDEKEITKYTKPSEEVQKLLDEGDYDLADASMFGLDDIINSKDPSTLQKVIYIGEEKRNILEAWVDREDKSRRFEFKATPYVFDAYYENGKIFEILIYFENEKKKSKGKAESLAEKYAFMIGQMPNVLLQRLDAAHIYADVPGISNAAAWTRVINIHPQGEGGYVFGTAIEELFIHELVHASLDKPIHGAYKRVNKKRHENTAIKSKKLNWGNWRKAVKKDKKKYITEYAKTSIHEDLAESFTAWLALRYKNDRISDLQKQKIENRIPNRIKFFDEQQFDMHPLVLNN